MAGKLPPGNSWFLTQNGRKFSFGMALAASVGGFTAHWYQHSFGLEKYKEFVQMYREGQEAPLSDKVLRRAEQALKDCNLSERDLRPGVKFFQVVGDKMFYAGSSYLRWGMLIGIPRHFAYGSTSDVEKSELQLSNTNEIDWSRPAGKQLLSSLVLSENAQKYAIARTIHRANTSYPIVNGLFASTAVIISYMLGRRINEHLNLYQQSRKGRMAVYAAVASLGTMVYYSLKDSTSIYWDRCADDLAAGIGDDYLKGGVEYYEKLLQRNKALRTLMGKDGESRYTVHGNETVFIRTKALPLTERLDHLRDKLAEKDIKTHYK